MTICGGIRSRVATVPRLPRHRSRTQGTPGKGMTGALQPQNPTRRRRCRYYYRVSMATLARLDAQVEGRTPDIGGRNLRFDRLDAVAEGAGGCLYFDLVADHMVDQRLAHG